MDGGMGKDDFKHEPIPKLIYIQYIINNNNL